MTACSLGNGFNDVLMFEESALSIAIIEREGTIGEIII